jgi:hypothetical protein
VRRAGDQSDEKLVIVRGAHKYCAQLLAPRRDPEWAGSFCRLYEMSMKATSGEMELAVNHQDARGDRV